MDATRRLAARGCGGLNRAMDLPHPAFTLTRPRRHSAPVVFSSAHSGRDYPPAFVASARLDAMRLRRSEDAFVDLLYASAPRLGAPLLAANFPRAFCDANREPWELDPGMFEDALPDWVNVDSPRVAAGLGTIAKLVGSGENIYGGRLHFAEAEARVRDCWQPFHAALAELLETTRLHFGAVLLVDCHSMPGNALPARAPADFVLGDAYGTACTPAFTALAEQTLRGMGYRVRRNEPYAGGFITRHYGRPRQDIHALQIEINRALYMDEAAIAQGPRFDAVADDLARLVAVLTEAASGIMLPGLAEAAE